MKSATSLLKIDKSFKSSLRLEAKKNLFFLIASPLLAIIVPILIISAEFVDGMEFDASDLQSTAFFACDLLGALLTVVCAVMAFASFRYLYNQRKTDFFGSLPINRTTRFLSKSIIGVIVIILSMVFFGATILCLKPYLKAFTNQKIDFDYALFFLRLLTTALALIASYFLYSLIAVCSGKGWHYLLFVFLASEAQVGFSKLFSIPSYNIAGFGVKCAGIANLFIPSSSIAFEPTKYGFGYPSVCIGMAFTALVLFYLGVWRFNKRKNECASSNNVPQFILAFLLGGISLSFFNFISIPEDFYLNILIGITLTFVLFLIASLIFYRKAIRRLFLIEWLIISGVMTVLLIVSGTNAFGWSNSLPKTEEVDYVCVKTMDEAERPSEYSNLSILRLFDESYTDEEPEKYELHKQESIQKILAIHKAENEEYRKSDTAKNDSTVRFEYHLKNGKVISRPVYYSYDGKVNCADKVAALKESREQLVNKYSEAKNLVPVICFGDMREGSLEAVADYEMLNDIYDDYLAMSDKQALEAMESNVNSYYIFIQFYYSSKPVKKVYREPTMLDVSLTKELRIVSSAKKTTEYFKKLNNIRGFTDIDKIKAEDIMYVCKTPIEFLTNSELFFDSDEMNKYLNEKVIGKYPTNSNTVGDYYDSLASENNKKVTAQIFNAPKLTEFKKDETYYGVFFITKDKKMTPVYIIDDSVPLFDDEEDFDEFRM